MRDTGRGDEGDRTLWEVADSLCLKQPVYGLAPEALMGYAGTIAQTFYA